MKPRARAWPVSDKRAGHVGHEIPSRTDGAVGDRFREDPFHHAHLIAPVLRIHPRRSRRGNRRRRRDHLLDRRERRGLLLRGALRQDQRRREKYACCHDLTLVFVNPRGSAEGCRRNTCLLLLLL